MHWQSERLPFDVPERQIHRSHGVDLLPAGRVKPGDVHLLPDRFNLEGVLADQSSSALFQCVLRAPFADSGDPDIGLHCHDHVALIE